MARMILLGVLLVAVAGIGSTAAPEPDSDLAGVYRCDGMNPDGTPYQGVVEISKVRGTFRVRWTMDDGSIMGVGIYSGGVFAVSYYGGAPAVVVYKVNGERLVGEWTMGGMEGAVYAETLTKTAAVLAPQPQEPRRPRPNRRTNPARGGVEL